MADVTIKIRVSDDGSITLLDQASQKLGSLGQAGDKAKSGIGNLVSGMADMKAGLDIITQYGQMALKMVGDVENLGSASLKAKSALDQLSGNKSAEYVAEMSKSTKGLVDNMRLTEIATKALGLNLVTTSSQAADLAKIGTVLGETFRGSATEGVETLTVAMMRVGLVGLLDNIGISGMKVKERFQELKKEFSDEKAWSMAVLEVGRVNADKLEKQLDATGSALDRLGVKAKNFATGLAENVAAGIEGIIGNLETIIQYNHDSAIKAAIAARDAGNVTGAHLATLRANNLPTTREDAQSAAGVGKLMNTMNTTMASGTSYLSNQAYTEAENQKQVSQRAARAATMRDLYSETGSGLNLENEARRRREKLAEQEKWKDPATRDAGLNRTWETNRAYEEAKNQKDLQDGVKIVGDRWKEVTGIVQGHLGILQQMAKPIAEQNALLERRSKIQSIDQAFGVQKDGLYSEMGGGLGSAAQNYRDKVEADLRKKIGTPSRGYTTGESAKVAAFETSAAQRRAEYQASLKGRKRAAGDPTNEKLMKDYDKKAQQESAAYRRQNKIGGKVYSKKDYEADIAAVDNEIKKAMDDYAIATGQATKESIAFRDIQGSVYKQLEAGSITTAQAAKSILAMANAAKDGKVSMKELMELQKEYGTVEQKKEADDFLSEPERKQRARAKAGEMEGDTPTGIAGKDTGRYKKVGEGDEGATNDPYGGVKKSADEAKKASMDLAAQGPVTGAALVLAGAIATGGLQLIENKAKKVQEEVRIIQGLLSGMVGQLNINIGFSSDGGTPRGSTGRPTGGRSATPTGPQ